jgi:mono/diheme cytochrome c family protein
MAGALMRLMSLMRYLRLAWVSMVVLAGCDGAGERTQLVLFPDMMESVPREYYERILLPPEGTIPVGYHPFPFGEGEDEAIRAGEELVNPFEPSPEVLRRGREVFETMCMVCHGARGEGDGPIIGRFPNPPSLVAERARSFPDGRIFHVITRGQGIMPSHAVQVLPDDRWKVVLYLRELQAGGDPP